MTVLERVESLVFRAAMALPPWLVRRVAGRPVILDGQVLDAETQWMLRLARLARDPAIEAMPIEQGRLELRRKTALTGGRQPVASVRDLDAGRVPARLYVGSTAGSRSPLLVFLHGGGMFCGDLESHDATCRLLAERAGLRVLALDYRLGPEHQHPAAHEDAWAGYEWAVEHATELDVDPERIAVGGDSAGGYLSAVVALRAANSGVPCAFQLLVYPATDFLEVSESRQRFGAGFVLTREFMDLADTSFFPPGIDRSDPMVSVLRTEKIPEGLAPALVVTAGFDALRDEGEAYARLLAGAGVQVELQRYPGMIHGFFNVVGVGRTQRAAVAEIAAKLKGALTR